MLQSFYRSGLTTSTYLFDVVRGKIPIAYPLFKFGINNDVGTSMQIVAPQGGTLHYLSTSEQLQVSSSSTNDVGGIRTSGYATGGSFTTLEDNTKDFVSLGVQVGDAVINETDSSFGIVTEVSSTTLTVFNFSKGIRNYVQSGDSYKIIYASGAGAALLYLEGVDDNYDLLTDFVILNGTNVVNTNKNFFRIYDAEVCLTGSSGVNEGDITIKDNSGTYTLLQVNTQHNKSLAGYWSVPRGYTFYLMQGFASETSNQGATVYFFIRNYIQPFQLRYVVSLSGNFVPVTFELPLKLNEKSDIEVRASSNASGASVSISFHGWCEKNF